LSYRDRGHQDRGHWAGTTEGPSTAGARARPVRPLSRWAWTPPRPAVGPAGWRTARAWSPPTPRAAPPAGWRTARPPPAARRRCPPRPDPATAPRARRRGW